MPSSWRRIADPCLPSRATSPRLPPRRGAGHLVILAYVLAYEQIMEGRPKGVHRSIILIDVLQLQYVPL